jgi:LuxR family transcriptional regulator, quorum-sensing system regulator SolR
MQLSNNHLFLTSSQIIKTISNKLEKYGIFHFDYCRSYSDGSRICLTTNPDALKAYFSEKQYLKGTTEAAPALYKKQAVLCSALPNQTGFQWARNHFKMDHAIYLINPNTNYCEFFSFASFPEYPEVINFYLNNLDILQNFIDFFKVQAAPLITKAEKFKLFYEHHDKPIRTYKISDLNELEKFQSKNHQIKNNREFQNLNMQHDHSLSIRQLDCAKYLLDGLQYREIASKLNLSVRTIETHIEYLKTKLDCRNKSELILKLSKIFM